MKLTLHVSWCTCCTYNRLYCRLLIIMQSFPLMLGIISSNLIIGLNNLYPNCNYYFKLLLSFVLGSSYSRVYKDFCSYQAHGEKMDYGIEIRKRSYLQGKWKETYRNFKRSPTCGICWSNRTRGREKFKQQQRIWRKLKSKDIFHNSIKEKSQKE